MIKVDKKGHVVDFSEKPKLSGWASAGFFVFNRRVLDHLVEDASCILEKEPLEALARKRQLVSYQHDGFFFAMDTYREYLHLNELWNSGKAPWKVW
jgi:glucose-1-phosphate cytidylyltransferase